MSEKLKKMNFVEGLLRKLRFCEWATPKMQKIIKQAGPSIQLLETVNFAFMKIFDFLIKTALFGAFCFSWVIRVTNYSRKLSALVNHQARFSAVICDTNHPRKAERPQKGLF